MSRGPPKSGGKSAPHVRNSSNGTGYACGRLASMPSISASTSTKNESADEVVAIIRTELERLAAA